MSPVEEKLTLTNQQKAAHSLKARLEWGEPALTILDVRDRMTYNKGHVMGAMPMDMESLVERAQASLDKNRDIYVYGASEADTVQAASRLRMAGFKNVTELIGGLSAWKEIGGACEGTEQDEEPGSDAYNIVDRIAEETK